ncbi:hypothetical protein OHS33_01470 [Streptomyces sp. NBC_00536]|uniref:hypothetical protein n=1 Tax=Streptomyces sp. NBC_00536 TaxID=2975769 RepID=UPI002E806870|nr:hypothetical protein [Streptomyces sp. NBC_00536]WUC77133.1 hypothetical protein OHS33_01470 [Streptomyces sp. NBC_00536]
MTLQEGQRVQLAADIRLTEWVAVADGPSTGPSADPSAPTGTVAGSPSLAAGTPGTVDRVVTRDEQSPEAGEYLRLSSLLDSYGHEMPPASRQQLEEKVGSLEPAWTAYQEQRLRATVRVRFDNGFILDDAPEHIFTPA